MDEPLITKDQAIQQLTRIVERLRRIEVEESQMRALQMLLVLMATLLDDEVCALMVFYLRQDGGRERKAFFFDEEPAVVHRTMFELAGRLERFSRGISHAADAGETTLEAMENHVGHGCPQDPKIIGEH